MTTRWKQKCKKYSAYSFVILLVIAVLIVLVLHFCGFFGTSSKTLPATSERSLSTDQISYDYDRNHSVSVSHISNNFDSISSNDSNENVSDKIKPANSSEESTATTTIFTNNGSQLNNTQGSNYHDIDKTATTQKPEEYHREELIRPAKIHHLPLQHDDLLYESKRNGSDKDFTQHQRITGNYRNSSSRIWDPHPEYDIDAFGHHLHLVLYQDASFMPDTLKITHVYANRTEHFEHDAHQHAQLQGCFYKGVVRGDDESVVMVSLCNGMRGHIRTSFGSFFIEPVEEYTKEDSNILHKIRRESRRHKDHHFSHKHDPSCPIEEHMKDGNSDIMDDDEENILNGDTWTARKRRKRNIDNDRQYTVEVLIAVDRKMDKFHGSQTHEYVLTLMQIVSSIYADASIGNSINVTLINIMIMKDDLRIEYIGNGVYASQLLKRFCSFIAKQDVHYDTAILLTREQICRNTPETKCDTLGLAELGTVCKKQSCSIVQDNGLPAAFTIAHELGHVLSMPHDDDAKCGNFHKKGKRKLHIMSSTMGEEIHPWSWSDCSRHFVTEFLEKDEISCLTNKPNDIMRSKSRQLPGEAYDLDQQCELIHGANAKHCNISSEDERECVRLWCFDRPDSHDCRSSNLPWADGTPCHDRMWHWCQKGSCVRKDRSVLKPVDGGWGPFSEYSQCSRTCGGGIQESTRKCNSPTPENGGKYCPGDRKRWRSCNTQDCIEDEPDFREQQCSNFNGNNFALEGVGNDVRWVPKYGVSPKDECKLFCRVENSAAYFLLSEKVKDGTTCSYDSFDKCVNGICRPAGCDNQLNSQAKLDKCGVCQGNNDTCTEIVKSIYRSNLAELPSAGTSLYFRVAKIPKGAANIEITQPEFTMENYIVLVNDKNEYLLNGNKLISTFAKRFPYGGITFDYTGSNSTLERVNTTYSRRIERDLFIEILSLPRQSEKRDGIVLQYKYTQETQDTPAKFEWGWSDWSPCNSECDGQKQKVPICVRRGTRKEYPRDYCNEDIKPHSTQVTICNQGCEFSFVTKKGECNCTIGSGIRKLRYECVKTVSLKNYTEIVEKKYCNDDKPRPGEEGCSEECGHWTYSEWSECEGNCDNATRTRTAHCQMNGVLVDDYKCIEKKKPLQIACSTGCYDYSQGEKTPCSVTCGVGVRTTAIYCKHNNQIVDKHFCAGLPMPSPIVINCTMPPCPKQRVKPPHQQHGYPGNRRFSPQNGNRATNHVSHYHQPYGEAKWRVSSWSECRNCRKNRTVQCSDPMRGCSQQRKPQEIVNCCSAKYKFVWSSCSAQCGKGKRERRLVCWLFSEQKKWIRKVDESKCKHARIPKRKYTAEKECDAGRCLWRRGNWTPCSRNCSIEYSTRPVFCQQEKTKHKVNEEHCRTQKKPHTKKRCYKHRTTTWCHCDGYQYKSIVQYIPRRTQNMYQIRCPKPTINTKLHRCVPNHPKCIKSCADIRRFTREDGEYPMTIRGKNVSIYCHNLVENPKEYLTLPMYQENYSYYYQAKAKNIDKCPTPYDTNEVSNGQPSIHTVFTKIRIELDRMRVNTSDFTFATTQQRGVTPMPYASAGDCFSRKKECPRGRFSINLSGTGFRVHQSTKWREVGSFSVIKWFRKPERPYQSLGAYCGGYCGNCQVIKDLLLDVV